MQNPDKLKKILVKAQSLEKGKEFAYAEEFINIDEKIDSKVSEIKQSVESISEELKKKLEEELVYEVDEQKIVDSVLSKVEIPVPENGKNGLDGKDYVLTEKDKKDIADTIKVPIVEKIIEKTETIIEQPIDRTITEIKEVAITDPAEIIVEKINTLPTDEDEYKIDAKHIKNLPKVEKTYGGSKLISTLADTNVIGATNGQYLKYNSSTKLWDLGEALPMYTGGLPYEVPFINSAGTALDTNSTFTYNLNEEYLYLQTRNSTNMGALVIDVRDRYTATTFNSSIYDKTTTYSLADTFSGGISAEIGSLGSDNTALYLKVDTGNTDWNRIVSMDSDNFIRNPAYYTGGSADILFSTPGTGKFQILNESNGENRLWVDNTNLYFGDKTAVNTGAYFSFEADFYFTFWGFTGYRAMDVDLSSLSTMMGDLDGLVNGGIAVIDNLGTLNDFGLGFNVGYPTAQVGIPGYLAMASTFNINPNTGLVSLKAGSSTSLLAKAGGKVHVNTSAVGNVGTGEDDLMTYSVPASMLDTNGQSLCGRATGTIANNVNAKRLRLKFGSTTILDTGAAGIPVSAAISWTLDFEIIRTGATTQKVNANLSTNNATLASYVGVTTASETLSGAVTLKLTGEAVSNNDIVEETLQVYFEQAV